MVHLFALGFSDSSFSVPKGSGITDLLRIALVLWEFFYTSIFIFYFCEECHGVAFGLYLLWVGWPSSQNWSTTPLAREVFSYFSVFLKHLFQNLNSHCIGLSFPLTCFPWYVINFLKAVENGRIYKILLQWACYWYRESLLIHVIEFFFLSCPFDESCDQL